VPRVSVVIPTYNHEKYVAEAIQSVLDQTYQDFEIVITNDGSTDRTVEVISKFTDPRIKLLSFEKNRGFIAADNNCIRNSSGEFVAELSSDDMFLPRKLEEQVNFLDEHPDIAAVFGYPYLIDEDGNDFTDVTSYYYHVFNQPNRTRHEWLHYFFYRGNGLAHPSALIRRDCLEDIGYGDERLVQLPDLDMWIRLCMKYSIHILPEKVFKFRIRQGEANLSGNREETRIRDVWEHEQVLKHFLHIKSVDELCKIFPQMEEKRETIEGDLIPFFIAQLAMEVDSIVHRKFAQGVLFDLLGDRKTAWKIEQKYGFVYRDLIKITGDTDIYNFRTVTGQLGEIEDLKTAQGQQRAEIEDLKSLAGQQRAEIENLKSLAEQQRAEIENLKSLAGQQRSRIEGLKSLEKKMRHEIMGLHKIKNDQQNAIEYLGTVREKQRVKIGALQSSNEVLRSSIEQLRSSELTQRAEIDRLKTIENSSAWRIVRKGLDIIDTVFRHKSYDTAAPVPLPIEKPEEPVEKVIEEPVEEVIDEQTDKAPSIVSHCDRVAILFDTVEVSGWAVAPQGIEKVEIYCDGMLLGNAIYGQLRFDVQEAFPLIQNSDRSGFIFFGVLGKVLPSFDSEHELIVRAIDNSNQYLEKEFLIKGEDYYSLYLRKTTPDQGTLHWMKEVSNKFCRKPLISLCLLLEDGLSIERTLESIKDQTYPFWEIILFCRQEAMSTADELKSRIGEDRLRICSVNGLGILRDEAKGEFLAFLNSGDMLAPHALFEMVKKINMEETVDLVYSDEDVLADGQRKDFFFKPDWSPDLLLSMNYIGQFFLIKRDLFKNIDGVKSNFSGESFYDLLLRAAEHTQAIGHVPLVLYTKGTLKKNPASGAATVLKETLARRGIRGEVIPLDAPGTYRIKREIIGNPAVSIIIPTAYKNPEMLSRCLHSIADISTYRNYEIILIDNSYGELALEDIVKGISQPAAIQTIAYEEEFNFSRMNNLATALARGEYLIFLNDDTEVITPDWIEGMLEHAQRPEVGVTGVKLLYPNRTIQHAGMFLVDSGGGARHAFRHLPADSTGYFGFLNIVRNCTAVTGACMMVSRRVFEEVGGFDENLRVECNDVDFCLKANDRGYLVVWTPFSLLFHHELATRGKRKGEHNVIGDHEPFIGRWGHVLEKGDPCYNPNLTLDSDIFSLNLRPVLIEHYEPYLASNSGIQYQNNISIDREEIKKILVIKLDHIGDIILSLPALKMLRNNFPNAHITMLVGRWIENLVRKVSGIDDVIAFDFFFEDSERGKRHATVHETEHLENILKSRKFDLAIDLRRHPETRNILELSGARYMAGYCSGGDVDSRLAISLKVPKEAEDISSQTIKPHITAQLCELILALDKDSLTNSNLHKIEVPFISSDKANDKIHKYSLLLQKEFLVGIHPGSGNLLKQWPEEYFARLADLFIERNNASVLMFGGEKDKDLVLNILDMVKNRDNVVSLAGEFSLEVFMAMVEHCHLFIGNDSGPCHIASVRGVPTLAIFGGKVSPYEWHPLGDRSMSVRADVTCSPCYKALPVDCPFGLKCLRFLWPEKVFDAAWQLMVISGKSGAKAKHAS
jgi:lipopolysaccharide heptosyltransferase II